MTGLVEYIKTMLNKTESPESDYIVVVNSRLALDIGELLRAEKIHVAVFGDPVVKEEIVYLVHKKTLRKSFTTDEKGRVHFVPRADGCI